jgi:hypothetical protein
MPVKVRARKKGEGGKPWKIVEVAGGAVVGESDTKQKAEISASYRNQAIKKKKAGK